MALSTEEQEIVAYGKKAGKSKADVVMALDKYRTSQAQAVETEKPKSGFMAALKDAPSDILGGFKKAGEAFNAAGEDIVETAGRKDRTLAEKATMIGGRAFGGGAQGVGELLTGGLKTLVSPETEQKVKEGVEGGINKVLKSEEGQKLLNQYSALDPRVRDQIDAAGGFAAGLLELIGAKGAGKAASTGSKVVRETAQSATEAGKRSLSTAKDAVVSPVRTLVEKGRASGLVQTGKELVERVPRAVERLGEKADEAAARAERINSSSPAVKEAIKSKLDDKIINTVEQADSETLKGYKEILDVAGTDKPTLGVKTRPEIVAGKAAAEQYKVIDAQRRKVGEAIGEAVDELSKTTKVDMSDSYRTIDNVLSSEGIAVRVGNKGPMLDFSGSRFTPAERTKIQELYRLATEAGTEISPSQVHKMDNLFSKLQREAKFEGIGDIFVKTAQGEKPLFSVFRDVFSGKLDEVVPGKFKDLNSQYRTLKRLTEDVENSLIKSGNFNASADPAKAAQTALRRIFSDATSAADYGEIADLMNQTARQFGYKGATPKDLSAFATEMRKLFPDAVPPTSFTGINNMRLLNMAEKVMDAGAPGAKDQQKALRKLLEEMLEKSRTLTK